MSNRIPILFGKTIRNIHCLEKSNNFLVFHDREAFALPSPKLFVLEMSVMCQAPWSTELGGKGENYDVEGTRRLGCLPEIKDSRGILSVP